MTEQEKKYAYGVRGYRCCFCGEPHLADGPRGGIGMNMTCHKCGAVFNLIQPRYREIYGAGVEFFGQIIRYPTTYGDPRNE